MTEASDPHHPFSHFPIESSSSPALWEKVLSEQEPALLRPPSADEVSVCSHRSAFCLWLGAAPGWEELKEGEGAWGPASHRTCTLGPAVSPGAASSRLPVQRGLLPALCTLFSHPQCNCVRVSFLGRLDRGWTTLCLSVYPSIRGRRDRVGLLLGNNVAKKGARRPPGPDFSSPG